MGKKKTLWLAILAVVVVLLLSTFVAFISHPCRQRLKRTASVLNEIWNDRNLITQLKTPEDYQRILKEQVNEPLACPDTGAPYQFFPEASIVLADAQPHKTRKFRFAIEWRHTRKGETFRVVIWSPAAKASKSKSTPSFFRILFEFIWQLTSWFNPPFRPRPADCQTNLRNVNMALMMYIQDYDEKFPPMKNVARTQLVLSPYTHNMGVFFCPITKQPYRPNPHLHHKPLPTLYYPAETPSFYEPVIHPDGLRGVAYADGPVRFATPSQWQTIQKRYKLPLP